MRYLEPVPFRLRMKGADTLDSRGARSVGYRADGLLYLEVEDLRFEWAVERTIEFLSLSGARSEVERFDYEETLVPVAWVTEVRVGGYFRPHMLVRAARLDAFDDMPSSRPGAISLRLLRRHRHLATTMAAAIDEARRDIRPPDAEGSEHTPVGPV